MGLLKVAFEINEGLFNQARPLGVSQNDGLETSHNDA